jgi:tape measure domain-containing protein
MSNGNDWILGVDLETSKVHKKIDQIENRLKKQKMALDPEGRQRKSRVTSSQQKADLIEAKKKASVTESTGRSRERIAKREAKAKVRELTAEQKLEAEHKKRLAHNRAVNSAKVVMIQAEKKMLKTEKLNAALASGNTRQIKEQAALLKSAVLDAQRLGNLEARRLQDSKDLTRQTKEQERVAKRVINATSDRGASSRLVRLTETDRVRGQARIDEKQSQIAAGVALLAGRDDLQSVQAMRRLKEAQKELSRASENFDKVVYKADKRLDSYAASMVRVQHALNQTRNHVKQTERSLRSHNFTVNSLTHSVKNLARSYLSVFAAMGAGVALYNNAKQLDSLKASMLAASGSAQQAKADFEFIRGAANDLGRDLFTAAKGFQQIGTSARAAGFGSKETREFFLAAAEGATAYGLSVEDTQGVMRAFSQILSKGSVQAEELRGQLGDRLFGSFQLAAKAMGVTTDELNDMLKAGEVGSKEFMPRFAKALRKVVRETGALEAGQAAIVASQNRFNTSLTTATEKLIEMGGMKQLFDVIFGGLTNVVNFLTPALAGVSLAISHVAQAVSWLLSPVVDLVKLIGVGGGDDTLTGVFYALTYLLGAKTILFLMGTRTSVLGLAASFLKLIPTVAASTAAFVSQTLAQFTAAGATAALSGAVSTLRFALWSLVATPLGPIILGMAAAAVAVMKLFDALFATNEELIAQEKELEGPISGIRRLTLFIQGLANIVAYSLKGAFSILGTIIGSIVTVVWTVAKAVGWVLGLFVDLVTLPFRAFAGALSIIGTVLGWIFNIATSVLGVFWDIATAPFSLMYRSLAAVWDLLKQVGQHVVDMFSWIWDNPVVKFIRENIGDDDEEAVGPENSNSRGSPKSSNLGISSLPGASISSSPTSGSVKNTTNNVTIKPTFNLPVGSDENTVRLIDERLQELINPSMPEGY